jgi:P-type Cu2+ transporter
MNVANLGPGVARAATVLASADAFADAGQTHDAKPTQGLASCTLEVYDMDCVACALLIEEELRKLPGVKTARVHFATQRARVSYDAARIGEAEISARVAALGHALPQNARASDRASVVRQIRRRFQWHTGVAAFCAMQIMMFSVPRYLGAEEIERELGRLMDGAALALTLPVLLFCSGSFFRGARREWRLRRLGMDSAIAISLVLAFVGSLWHLWVGSGHLYFDSIAMFVALLLGVRWFEWEKREQNRALFEQQIGSTAPARYAQFNWAKKAISAYIEKNSIEPGGHIIMGRYEEVPVDGIVEDAAADLDESILTGESAPVRRLRNERVCAGAINAGEPFVMRATATAQRSTTNRLLDLADHSDRPDHRSLTVIVSQYFVPAMFAIAGLTFIALFSEGIELALERAIAVLIVSCPCALALAAPAARARAFAQLASRGVIVRRSESLERLADVDTFVFDKTGTLTDPSAFRITHLRENVSASRASAIVASLEGYANHPLASSLRRAFMQSETLCVANASWKPGEGVEGEIDGIRYRLGKSEFAFAITNDASVALSDSNDAALLLADANGPVCVIEFAETIREGARELLSSLSGSHSIELLSGDRRDRVERVAEALGITRAEGSVTAEQKQTRVETLQREGCVVAMVGDGWNDSVAFAKADVSIAASGAVDAALRGADIVASSNSLASLGDAIAFVKRLRRIVRENYVWAIAYNLIAIPVAAFGYVDPIVAAIGMATSSAVVMLNTMRLSID